MNVSKALLAGAVGGVVVAVYDFIVHGLIMDATYKKYTLFRQDANMVWFPILAIVIGVVAAVIFAKTRSSWAAGVKGGVTFGFWLGLIGFFATFYNPLVFNEFPYYLTWCMGSILLIGWLVYGAVVGVMYKGETT